MTDEEWVACLNPFEMLDARHHLMSARQIRLFAAACCRRVWHMLGERGRKAVRIAELFADGLRCRRTLAMACAASRAEAENLPGGWESMAATVATNASTPSTRWQPTRLLAASTAGGAWYVLECQKGFRVGVLGTESAVQADMLRDIVGPLPRPSIPPDILAWNGGTVVALAAGIYDDQAFDRLPVLGDALEEAGCEDAEILAHCRRPVPHVIGCWLVDLLLGKG